MELEFGLDVLTDDELSEVTGGTVDGIVEDVIAFLMQAAS
jgi:bacteriocin-like protein